MACVRWAETEAWLAVLRGPVGGRDMGAAVGSLLLSMVGPWPHRWPGRRVS